MAPTAASRPGGKFAKLLESSSDPSSSATDTTPMTGTGNTGSTNTETSSNTSTIPPKPKQPRGKFANLITSAPTSSSSSTGATKTKSILGPSYEDIRTSEIQKKKLQLLAATKRNGQVLSNKQVFADLDHAENLVLELISLASDTALSLSKLTSRNIEDSLVVDSKKKRRRKRKRRKRDLIGSNSNSTDDEDDSDDEDSDGSMDQDSDDNRKMTGDPNASTMKSNGDRDAKELSKQIEQNGKRYQDTLQKIHKLLTPHAHFVVPYGNLVDTRSDNAKSATASKPSCEENNMYIARLEKRLVYERRDLLKELIRLEKGDRTKSSV